jgi:hypothetical protein
MRCSQYNEHILKQSTDNWNRGNPTITLAPSITTTREAYCTCNDNSQHGAPVKTTTVLPDGGTSTMCQVPDPTGTPLCGSFGPEFGNKKRPKKVDRTHL